MLNVQVPEGYFSDTAAAYEEDPATAQPSPSTADQRPSQRIQRHLIPALALGGFLAAGLGVWLAMR